MIAIVNTPTGLNKYEIRINNRVIAKFKHKREDGLAACLRHAASTVDKMRDNKKHSLLAAMFDQQTH